MHLFMCSIPCFLSPFLPNLRALILGNRLPDLSTQSFLEPASPLQPESYTQCFFFFFLPSRMRWVSSHRANTFWLSEFVFNCRLITFSQPCFSFVFFLFYPMPNQQPSNSIVFINITFSKPLNTCIVASNSVFLSTDILSIWSLSSIVLLLCSRLHQYSTHQQQLVLTVSLPEVILLQIIMLKFAF